MVPTSFIAIIYPLTLEQLAVIYLTGVSPLDSLLHHITTPAFILPQLLNLSGSVLFAASLASSNISLAVPLANGTSLAATALVGHLLGDTITFWPGLPGVGLLILGVTLCTISSPS